MRGGVPFARFPIRQSDRRNSAARGTPAQDCQSREDSSTTSPLWLCSMPVAIHSRIHVEEDSDPVPRIAALASSKPQRRGC